MMLAHCPLNGESGHEAGRRLLAELYVQAAGEPMPGILTTPQGKPYFENSPWYFSVSHTKHHAFCILSRKNVAIDAEELNRRVNLKLADKVLSLQERAQFDAAGDKTKALLTFWVLKEAAAKLSGQGLTGFPNTTNFSLDDPRVSEIDGCLVAVMEA